MGDMSSILSTYWSVTRRSGGCNDLQRLLGVTWLEILTFSGKV